MSVDSNVFLQYNRMPTPAQIQAELQKQGFPLKIDTDFDVYEQVGFLPCQYKGIDCGFEYFFEEVDLDSLVEDEVLDAEERAALGNRDGMLTLSTHSSLRGTLSASLVCAVVCALSDGLWEDNGDPPFIAATEALAFAKTLEEDYQEDLESAEEEEDREKH